MAANTTLFMTPEESARIQQTVKDLAQQRKDEFGQQREPNDPKSLIQAATSTSLMQDLSAASLFGGAPQKQDQDTIVAYGIGSPYPPSTAKFEELKPMQLADLRMDTHHRGHVLSVRRVSPVVELKASSWAAVQGESKDDVERLELFLHKSWNGQDILNLGIEFQVKEPYFTLNSQGERVIRIDHPSDLVISAYSEGPESWRGKDESEASPTKKTPTEWKELGNAALQKQNYGICHANYTAGLKEIAENGQDNGTLKNDIHRNRSHVNLILQRYDEAKTDAISSLTHGEEEDQKSLDAKAYFRAGSAAYALGEYKEAQGYFEKQDKLKPGDQVVTINLKRVKLRQKEQESGDYDLNRAARTLQKLKGRPDLASFNGSTKVKNSPGAGRGLFATKAVEENQIIMAERAFCVVWSYEGEAFSALTADMRDDAEIRVFPSGLHKAVVRKLLNNPSQAEKVLDLYGDYEGFGKKPQECDGTPIIDTFQIHDIIQRNAFGPGAQTEDENYSNASTGLWVRAAYINHSCASNARKEYVGDLMVLRATRKIHPGEEIFHSYDESSDLDTRSAALKRTWNFKCKCALCAAEEADGADVRKKRKDLEGESHDFMRKTNPSGANKISINRAKRLRQYISDTYDEKRYKKLPRRALGGIESWLQAAPSK